MVYELGGYSSNSHNVRLIWSPPNKTAVWGILIQGWHDCFLPPGFLRHFSSHETIFSDQMKCWEVWVATAWVLMTIHESRGLFSHARPFQSFKLNWWSCSRELLKKMLCQDLWFIPRFSFINHTFLSGTPQTFHGKTHPSFRWRFSRENQSKDGFTPKMLWIWWFELLNISEVLVVWELSFHLFAIRWSDWWSTRGILRWSCCGQNRDEESSAQGGA